MAQETYGFPPKPKKLNFHDWLEATGTRICADKEVKRLERFDFLTFVKLQNGERRLALVTEDGGFVLFELDKVTHNG